MFEAHLARWGLVADGEAIATRSSDLLPVRRGGLPAMLKVAREDEECWGWLALDYWDGDGAARVLARDGHALLLERAMGPLSLSRMVYDGHDDEASRILCMVAARLHAPRSRARPTALVTLDEWFAPLAPIARAQGGILATAAAAAHELLADPRDVVVLHGDLHHDNVLDAESRGWIAVDPKRLLGERAFDFANILRNPDSEPALAPGRFERQLDVVAAAAKVDRRRLLQWVLAFTGLSAAWYIVDGQTSTFDLAIAERASAELARTGSV